MALLGFFVSLEQINRRICHAYVCGLRPLRDRNQNTSPKNMEHSFTFFISPQFKSNSFRTENIYEDKRRTTEHSLVTQRDNDEIVN